MKGKFVLSLSHIIVCIKYIELTNGNGEVSVREWLPQNNDDDFPTPKIEGTNLRIMSCYPLHLQHGNIPSFLFSNWVYMISVP